MTLFIEEAADVRTFIVVIYPLTLAVRFSVVYTLLSDNLLTMMILPASMSLSTTGHAADLNPNGTVDPKDLQAFADLWLETRILLAEDIKRDGLVDLSDFAMLADSWLWER